MSNPKEYVVTGALMKCSEGTVPMPFNATPRTSKIMGLKAGNELDIAPMVNIPSFIICKKLTQMANGVPTPCAPVVSQWQDTYVAKVGGGKALLKKSCIQCTLGQGKIEFMTSGQLPLPPSVVEDIQLAKKEAEEALDQAEKEKNSVGEAGFLEGMIPIWGSGRDLIHSVQTGDMLGVAMNSVFLAWDVLSVAAGVVSFGTATAAMMAGKAGVRTALKAAGKVTANAAKKQGARLISNAKNLQKGIAGLIKGFRKETSSICVTLSCFPAGTPIAVVDGYKNIEDIEIGDKVWAWDKQTGNIGLKSVVSTVVNETDFLIKLGFGREHFQTTPEHPIWVGDPKLGGWREAATLKEGDEIWLLDKRSVELSIVEHIPLAENKIKVFNFEVADWHTYFVGLWMTLVHNADCATEALKKLLKYGRAYVREIAKITGRKIHPKQLKKIKEALRNKKFTKLSKEATEDSRKEFGKVKDKLIKEWEKETGQKWPRYEEDVLGKNGKPYLRKGDPYDAHHIIENTHGGPHEWWNIHPASNPTQHQGGIHGKNGIAKLYLVNKH